MRTFSKTVFPIILSVAAGVIFLGGYAADNNQLSWLSVSTAVAKDDYEVISGDEFEWTGTLAEGKEIEVSGLNGEIIAKPAEGRQASVSGIKRAHRGADPDAVEIRVRESGRGVQIWAKYPDNRGWDNHEKRGDVSVDFTVYVPSGVVFSGNNVNGDIEAQGLEGPVDLDTVNGSIKLSTTQDTEASTVNGSIQAEVATSSWTEPLSLETVNGSIELKIPKNVDADFYAETVNGDISSDFPVTIQGRFGPKEISGKIGKGGRELHLATVNGSIKLIELRR
jgi:hypothetical protein